MPSVTPTPCTHDLGPGTTICLRCRQEQREIANARQLRLLGRGGTALVTLVVLITAGTRAVNAWRASPAPARVLVSSTSSTPTGAVRLQGEPTALSAPVTTPVTTPVAVASLTAAAAAPAAASTPASSARPPLALVIPTGDSELADSVIAQRAGDSVFVDFDTELGRTRRPEKFERMVRQTLPAVYGHAVDSLLAALPEGRIVAGGGLLNDLPLRGIHLPLSAGWTLRLTPETRRGVDGPLVKSYRAKVVKAQS